MHSRNMLIVRSISLERPVLTLLILLAVLLITPLLTTLLLHRTGAVRSNFRGESIPAMFGLSIVVSSVLLLRVSMNQLPIYHNVPSRWIALVLSFAALDL